MGKNDSNVVNWRYLAYSIDTIRWIEKRLVAKLLKPRSDQFNALITSVRAEGPITDRGKEEWRGVRV